jgi:hypothetical protein
MGEGVRTEKSDRVETCKRWLENKSIKTTLLLLELDGGNTGYADAVGLKVVKNARESEVEETKTVSESAHSMSVGCRPKHGIFKLAVQVLARVVTLYRISGHR